MLVWIVLAICASAGVARAHKPSDAHVAIAVDGDRVHGSIGIAVRDLDGALDLDGDGDGRVTWAEAQAAEPRIAAYVAERFELSGDGARCELALDAAALVDFTDGAYWTVPFRAACAGTSAFALTYRILFDLDAQHRGLVQVQTPAGKQTLVVRDGMPLAIDLPEQARPGVASGVRHVLTSPPYLLVLACLVLPLVFVRRARWGAADAPRAVLADAAHVFGGFALASASSMALAAGGVIDLPARWIDLAIALSGLGVAAINLGRVVAARWDLSCELGLLHGLGAALALRALDADHGALALLGFALGTAIGGAVVVAALVPLLFVIRRTHAYQAILWGGSSLAGAVALVWTYRFL
ncbi:MAG: HupE/UreJ family protein [Deltaproteobacteria bacterium]|nr:HupE/UreJ family protein [Deltaproteobacteria bacterium]